jgi:hypothetical protein
LCIKDDGEAVGITLRATKCGKLPAYWRKLLGYVRDYLAEVNARLLANEMREIDPNDLEMAERYG